MFITNIRYGEKPIRKVYLGEKLIWKCVEFQGDTELKIDTQLFYYPSDAYLLSGTSINDLCADSILSQIRLTMMYGNSENTLYGDSTLNLMEFLLMAGSGKIESDIKASNNLMGAYLVNGSSNPEVDGSANCKLFIFNKVKAETIIQHNTFSIGCTRYMESVNATSISDFDNSGITCGLNAASMKSDVMKQFADSAVVGCLFLFKAKAFSESTFSNQANVNTFDMMPTAGETSSKIIVKSMCDLFDLWLMKGNIEFGFYNDAFISFYDATAVISNDQNITNGNCLIYVHPAVISNGNITISNDASSSIAIWYPAIGDGVVLVENDGVDITKDGDILEIRQAYQINIDNQNNILEVI